MTSYLQQGALLILACGTLFAAAQPPVSPDWTPRPAQGKVEPWEKMTDKDWVDGRFRQMDTGPYLNASVEYPLAKGKLRLPRATALRVGPKGEATVLFDRNQLRLAAVWSGGFLQHSEVRFGLLNTARPASAPLYASELGLGWANPQGKWDNPHPPSAPLPRDWGRFRGVHLHGARVILAYTILDADILETYDWLEIKGLPVLTRSLEIAAHKQPLTLHLGHAVEANSPTFAPFRVLGLSKPSTTSVPFRGLDPSAPPATPDKKQQDFVRPGMRFDLAIPPSQEIQQITAFYSLTKNVDTLLPETLKRPARSPFPLCDLTKGETKRWAPLSTKGEVAEDKAALVIDTLTVPHTNPYKALFFITGVDFLPNGDVAVCTAHGDVWLVKGVDGKLENLRWHRFATGLYQPLGLRVVDGLIHVIERGQLTRLHDMTNDGEADFYESFADQWHVGRGEHSFDSCLETDADGNFYFFKTGDTETPTGGCLLRTAKDGQKTAIFATGFRHPIGLGISPDGLITGADQEGNWMPSTRIDVYRQGSFHGDMRAHHRATPPTSYDPPLCWLPHHVDNSAGGQAWVPKGRWGPLAEMPLHLSYGRCRLYSLLTQKVDGVLQGGVFDLGLFFQSGIARGRFHPRDGHLYVVGLNGWQSAARSDGCLQRVRYTGKPLATVTGLEVFRDGVLLTFAGQVDRFQAAQLANYRIAQWNYLWTGDYGSKRYSVAKPKQVGQDDVAIEHVRLSADGRKVYLRVPNLQPVMQMQIAFNLRMADGVPLVGSVYNTIHKLAEPLTPLPAR